MLPYLPNLISIPCTRWWDEVRRILQIFYKTFVAQETIDMVQQFFWKIFHGPFTNFRFLFKTYLQQYFRVVLTVIFKLQITTEVNIHHNIHKTIFKKFVQKPLFFAITKIFYNNKIKIISRNSSSGLQQSINWIKFFKWD